MKTRFCLLVSTLLLTVAASAQVDKAAPEVTERGPNHRVVQCVVEVTGPDGKVVPRVSSVIELATGMHWRDEHGNWIESQDNH